MIHIQVAQNHDISIPQLIKKKQMKLKKKLIPFLLERRERRKDYLWCKNDFPKKFFHRIYNTQKRIENRFQMNKFSSCSTSHSHGCLNEKLNFNSLLFSFSLCRVILCFVIAPGTANRSYFFWVTGSFQIHTCQNRKLKKVEIFLCHCHLSIVVLWKIQLCF